MAAFYEKDIKAAAQRMLAPCEAEPEWMRNLVARCIRAAMINIGPGGWWLVGPKARRALIASAVMDEICQCTEAGSRTWGDASTLGLIVARLEID